MIITKQEIIQALRKEPLQTGSWVKVTDDPNCHVCAVGAVLRSCGLPNRQISQIGYHLLDVTSRNLGCELNDEASIEDVEKLLSKDSYMAALSAYFEGVARGDREETIKFVTKRFPSRLDISGVLGLGG